MFSVILQEVRCDDEELQQVLLTAIKNLYQAIAPVKQAGWGRDPSVSQTKQTRPRAGSLWPPETTVSKMWNSCLLIQTFCDKFSCE